MSGDWRRQEELTCICGNVLTLEASLDEQPGKPGKEEPPQVSHLLDSNGNPLDRCPRCGVAPEPGKGPRRR